MELCVHLKIMMFDIANELKGTTASLYDEHLIRQLRNKVKEKDNNSKISLNSHLN